MNKTKTKLLKDYYDCVVIGAGIGGLTAAALLAKAGKSVLLVEQHDRPGGYAHGFRRKHYFFDAGVHLTSGCGLEGYHGGQVIRKVLQAVNVFQQVEFIPVNYFSRAVFPGFSVSLPASYDAFVAKLAHYFPAERQGLSDLLSLCLQLTEEVAKADELMASGDVLRARECLTVFFQYRRATLAQVYDQFLCDPRLKALFATNWPYLGLPPSRVAFTYWATMLIGYLVDGAYYCRGGFQKLADTLTHAIELHCGDVIFRTAAHRIGVCNGQVNSIVLANGVKVNTEVVVANADMLQTINKLVGKEHFPRRYLQRLEKMQPSLSIFTVYIATDMQLDAFDLAHETFCYQSFDHDQSFKHLEQVEVTFISISVPSLIDNSLAPEGQHIILLSTLLPYDAGESWAQLKPKITQQMLDKADELLPGLAEHLIFVDAGSPETMHRYTLNHKGSSYGWHVTPAQTGANRIANRSPVEGLFFAGHWSRPGGGVYGVSVSGMQVAQQVLGITEQDKFWAYLEQKNR